MPMLGGREPSARWNPIRPLSEHAADQSQSSAGSGNEGVRALLWKLGPRYGKLRFHSVDRSRRPLVVVNYGDPRPPDPGSGDWWHFSLTVTTAPRRQETRRRLQRSLGAGVPVALGTRYGCRKPHGPVRIAVLTAAKRLEITASDCRDLLRASRKLRLA